MAYKYNEKSGEFEDIPQIPNQPSSPRVGATPVTPTQPPSTARSAGFLEGLGGIIVGILPYAAVILLVATCS